MPRADAARNRTLLIEAARDLFFERGLDVPLDDVARRAAVGNATLYRHFPTRSDLLVAVYADEVDALCHTGEKLLSSENPGEALELWLDAFVVHVATKRALALAATDNSGRTELFERWHAAMHDTAAALLSRAQESGQIRADLTVTDLLPLVSGAALASSDLTHARRLLNLLRTGLTDMTN